MIHGKILLFTAAIITAFSPISGCSKKDSGGGQVVTPPKPDDDDDEDPKETDVVFWLTNPDKTSLFKKQNVSLKFESPNTQFSTIEVNDATTYQTIDGFGYTLTGGSATHINKLQDATKDALLKELFKADDTNIGVSYLRISIGASDLSASTFTYDDVPAGQTDINLENFSIDKEKTDLIPVLKKIIALYPEIKILGSPWTAPVWMKDNGAFKGGSLKAEYYQAYANYFVKYIQA
ncbi:MAG: glucosylceramidase, partial [Sphingobacteriaceae bacterium]